jgi:hypothetical protein
MVTGMAMVALGATGVMLDRVRRSPVRWPVMLVHLAVYGSLWTIFVGATLHAANSRSGPRLEVLTILDILLSVVPMLAAGRMAWAVCENAGDA